MTPNEQKVDAIINAVFAECDVRSRKPFSITETLSAAGLIVTDEDVLNRELAELVVLYAQHFDYANREPASEVGKSLLRRGRAILAAKKPKERYRVLETDAHSKAFRWAVLDEGPNLDLGHSAYALAYFRTEPEAKAYMAFLNAEAGK